MLTAIVGIRRSGLCDQSVNSMIDLCISLFAQYSYHARLVLLSISDDKSSGSNSSFLSSVTEFVKNAATEYIASVVPLQESDSPRGGGKVSNGENLRGNSAADDKWRSRVRGYKKAALSPLQMKHKSAAALEASADHGSLRLSLWSSLLLLKSACAGCHEVQSLMMDHKFEAVLSSLIRLVVSSKPSSSTTKTTSPVWSPSEYNLAAIILAVAASFSYENIDCKRLLVQSGDNRLQLDKAPKTGSMLHQLAAIGLSLSVSRPARRLCLNIASELVRETVDPKNSISVTSAAQNTVLARTISLSLQDYLLKPNTNPDDIVFLIDALASCICSGQSVFASGVDGIRTPRNSHPKSQKLNDSSVLSDHSMHGNDSQPPSIPSFISWIWESHCDDHHVVSALLRMIGSIAENSSKIRRILANVTDGEASKVIVDILTLRSKDATLIHDRVHTTALVALWALLNTRYYYLKYFPRKCFAFFGNCSLQLHFTLVSKHVPM